MKPIVIWMEEKDIAKLTKEKLEEIIQQAYDQGYSAGYAAGCATSIATNPAPSSPYSSPHITWTPGIGPIYNPCVSCTSTGTSDDTKTHVTLKG